MSLSYTPGTRYSNPREYDIATEEVIHGFQVFERIEGDVHTGHKTFVDIDGNLVAVEMAERRRDDIIEANAHKLLWALESLVDAALLADRQGLRVQSYDAMRSAVDLLRKVKGDTAPEKGLTAASEITPLPCPPAAPLKSNYEAALDTVNALGIGGVARIVGLSREDETTLIEAIGGVAPWGRFAVEFSSTAPSPTSPSVRCMKLTRTA